MFNKILPCLILIYPGFQRIFFLLSILMVGGEVALTRKKITSGHRSTQPHFHEVYILGDMNIDLFKHHTHLPTGRYLDMLYSHNLLPVITKPTRITSHTATLIDHIYTNTANRLISEVIPVDISDHLPIFCTVETSVKQQNGHFYFRDYSKFNTESYIQDICTVDWFLKSLQSTKVVM